MTAPLELTDPITQRAAVLAEAQLWLGTPYRHQASFRDIGTDCLGLLRGVWRAIYGAEPEAPRPYTPDWAEASGEERLLAAARRHLSEVPLTRAAPGDVLLFRMKRAGPAKHLAILSRPLNDAPTFIHAYSGHGVCESTLGEAWRRRLAHAFQFPAPLFPTSRLTS